ncbi:MAG: hypothetical protein RIS22_762 [Actinomycetota bacterium]|jgi:hypothetical protein
MSDLADMLGIDTPNQISAGLLQSKDANNLLQSFQKSKSSASIGTKQKKVKPKVSREVLDLIGKDAVVNLSNGQSVSVHENGVSIEAEMPPVNLFKKKRLATNNQPAESIKEGWLWTPITNLARCM